MASGSFGVVGVGGACEVVVPASISSGDWVWAAAKLLSSSIISPIIENVIQTLCSIFFRDRCLRALYSLAYETRLIAKMLHYNQLTLSRLTRAMQTTHGPHFSSLSIKINSNMHVWVYEGGLREHMSTYIYVLIVGWLTHCFVDQYILL